MRRILGKRSGSFGAEVLAHPLHVYPCLEEADGQIARLANDPTDAARCMLMIDAKNCVARIGVAKRAYASLLR